MILLYCHYSTRRPDVYIIFSNDMKGFVTSLLLNIVK